MALGFAAVIGEGLSNLAEPWPLKVVLDNVLRSKPLPQRIAWMVQHVAGSNKLAILEFAALAVLAIAVVGAI